MENEVDTQNFQVRKEAMEMKSKNLKIELDSQLGEFKQEAAEFAKVALIAGGSLYLTYKIGKGLYKRNRRKNWEKKMMHGGSIRRDSSLMNLIKGQAGILLMALAKKRIAKAFSKK